MRTSTKLLIAAGAGIGGYLVWKKLIAPELDRRAMQERIDRGELIADNFPPEVLQLEPMPIAAPVESISPRVGTGNIFSRFNVQSRGNVLPFGGRLVTGRP